MYAYTYIQPSSYHMSKMETAKGWNGFEKIQSIQFYRYPQNGFRRKDFKVVCNIFRIGIRVRVWGFFDKISLHEEFI